MRFAAIILLTVAQAREPETVLRAAWAPPSRIDPHRARTLADSRVVGALFEGLTAPGAGGVTVAPGAAERWEEGEDGLTWTFTLREAKWSNGEALTAADFVSSWRRALRPSTGCPYRDCFRVFRNVGRHLDALRADGRSDVEEAEFGFEAADARTLKATLERRVPWLPDLLSFMCFAPVHGKTAETYGEGWTAPGRIVTCGPYLLEKASPAGLELRKNPGAGGSAGPDRILVEFISGEAALRKFEAGQLDWVGGETVPLEKASALKGFAAHPVWGVRFLRFNAAKAPFDRPGVRAAFARSIDRAALAEAGEGFPAGRLVPPGVPGYEGGQAPGLDAAAAVEALLRETGFDLATFPRVELLADDDPRSLALGRRLRDQLERTLGISVRTSFMKAPAFAEALARGEYAVALDGWAGDYFDPLAFLEGWSRGHARHSGGWGNPEFDGLLAAASRERDARRRLRILGGAEALLLSEAPAVPLVWPADFDLAGPGLKGLDPGPMGRCSLRNLRLSTK
jgi:oligopeptide transport system substrate-binding protein